MFGSVVLYDNGGTVVGYYNKIQEAIDAASDNYTIEAYAATYNENITVDKALSISAPEGASSTTIHASGGTAITILSDGVTIDGFTITNPDGNYGVSSNGYSNLTLRNNDLENIGDNVTSGHSYAISVSVSSADLDNILIEDNTIKDVYGSMTAGSTGNAGGVVVGFTNATNQVTNLVIQRNNISDLHADQTDTDGKLAYGILLAVGGITDRSMSENW